MPAKKTDLAPETKAAKARRYDGNEFPQTLIRIVEAVDDKGVKYDLGETRIVADPVELAAALKEGWSDPTP